MVRAVPKEKFGIMAKPSTLMIITLAAMIISPKLLVRDCTTTMAREKMACVSPEGSPSRITVKIFFLSGLRYSFFMSKRAVIFRSLSIHNMADTSCAMTVASATPATSICNPATNHTSSTILSTVATSRYTSADRESPSPRRIPQRIL